MIVGPDGRSRSAIAMTSSSALQTDCRPRLAALHTVISSLDVDTMRVFGASPLRGSFLVDYYHR